MGLQIPGQLLIIFALVANIVAGGCFYLVARGMRHVESLAIRAYHALVISSLLAGAWLYYLFFSDNFAFKYVYEYSDRHQSFFYTLSAFWGGQEGTYLLWLILNCMFGYLVLRWADTLRNWAMVIYSAINLFFLLILLHLSPFALLSFAAPDGLGLNPLLRDPWMVIHPPIVFIGYAIASVPFSLVIAAFITRQYDDLPRKVFPWVAVAALMLAGGNILGGYWAYKTLGWGGFWAWDPVENSSFVPWIIALALLHGLIIERRSGALRRTNLLMAAFLFLLVIYGTFLTRSGVLADFSVHSFTDLGTNQYLIGFMIFFTLLTLVLFALRARELGGKPMNYDFYGREFSLFAGMVVLFLFGVVVLFWTSLPVLTTWFTDTPRAADVATYNSFAQPLAVVIALLLCLSPFTTFANHSTSEWKKTFFIALMIALVLGFGLFMGILKTDFVFAAVFALVTLGLAMFAARRENLRVIAPSIISLIAVAAIAWLFEVRDYMQLLFFGVGAAAIVSNFIVIAGFFPARWKVAGGHLTHIGFGFTILGVLASSAFTTSEKVVIDKGKTGQAFGLTVQYNGLAGDMRQPNNEVLLVLSHGTDSYEARPQLYFSERMQGTMRRPFIDRSLLQDLYLAPQEVQQDDHQTSGGIILHKGESQQVGDVTLTFQAFDMGGHGTDTGMARFAAKIDVFAQEKISSIEPAQAQVPGPDGQPALVAVPDSLVIGGRTYLVSLDRILADQGAVQISIPGLADMGGGERIVLDISKKPLISLVWLGTSLILLGSLLTYFRRRDELGRPVISDYATNK